MWYVIQVKTGEESGIARKLKNQAIRAEVPIENRPIRSGGAWTKKEYILFPGYVFLDMDFTARNYYRVKEVPGVIRFLGDSKAPSTLSYLEAEWIRILSGSGEPLEPTLVREDGSGGITVISGVLKQLENRVLKWDKRSRKATFEITICGEARQVQLGIEVESGAGSWKRCFTGCGTAIITRRNLKHDRLIRPGCVRDAGINKRN